MFRMIEPDVETPQRGERFHLPTLRISMTDRTDLVRAIGELLLVTARARCVRIFARQGRLRRVTVATMTKQTRQSRVIFIVVFELRIIRLRKNP